MGFPYMFIVCTGTLQSISSDVKEAAKVDGATGFQATTKIITPLLLVAVAPLLVSSFAFNFNNFNTTPQAGDEVLHLDGGAIPHGDHRDDRPDPDDHAQHRQKRARLVRQERGQGGAQRLEHPQFPLPEAVSSETRRPSLKCRTRRA